MFSSSMLRFIIKNRVNMVPMSSRVHCIPSQSYIQLLTGCITIGGSHELKSSWNNHSAIYKGYTAKTQYTRDEMEPMS